jgi:hypothetical protein
MNDFNCTVLRERFTIEHIDGGSGSIIALSNRVTIELLDDQDRLVEHYVLRGQMLHTVVRLAGTILNTFQRTGPLLSRAEPIKWIDLWDLSAGGHERSYNHDLWVAIYHQGKPIFEQGVRHTFLDVVEQCDQRAGGSYENSLLIAEQMFNQAGRNVRINHETNIACTFQISETSGRSALILRSAQRTTTFVFSGSQKEKNQLPLNPVHFINAAAAFLEGIQLAFVIGAGNERIKRELIAPYSQEGMAVSSARSRLAELNTSLLTFENLHQVHYRPEKPEFVELINTAERMVSGRLDEEAIEAALSGR